MTLYSLVTIGWFAIFGIGGAIYFWPKTFNEVTED